MKRVTLLICVFCCLQSLQAQNDPLAIRLHRSLEKERKKMTQLPERVSPLILRSFETSGLSNTAFNVPSGSALRSSRKPVKADLQMNPQQDLIVGFTDPNEVVTITGNYFLAGNIIVVNHGRLNFVDANVVLKGNIIVADSAQFHIQGGKLTVLAEYRYQYFIWGLANSSIEFDSALVSINGQSWSATFLGSAHVVFRDTQIKEVVTSAVFGSPDVEILRSNPFEWVFFDSATVNVSQSGPHIFWFSFPDSSKATLSFPDGNFVNHFSVSATQPGISGIDYTVAIDSTDSVFWGLILQGGSDVTVKDSHLRTTGIQARKGDSLTVSGLVNDQHYSDFVAPISDRKFHLINSTLDTWNVYPWGVKQMSIDNSILGELGAVGGTETTVEASIVDGSGGYVFTDDSSGTIFSLSSIFSDNIASGRSVQIHLFSSILGGDVIATESSIMLLINSLVQQTPVARDTAVVVEAALSRPEVATIEQLLPLRGSAVVSSGPFTSVEFSRYRLEYGMGAPPQQWFAIGQTHEKEIRGDVLETWDTHGLMTGSYVVKLTLYLSTGDSLVAIRNIYLSEPVVSSVLDGREGTPETFALQQNYPNPFNPETTIRYQLPKAGQVTLTIYNTLGQEVRTLVNQNQTSGSYSVVWNGKNAAGELASSGMYFYKLQVGESLIATRKMLYLK